MVEPITSQTLQQTAQELFLEGLLHPQFQGELLRLVEDSDRVSNWTDASHYLSTAGYQRIKAGGPVSKVLRALAYLMARLEENHQEMADRGLQVTRVHFEQTQSGCSTYTGRVQVQVEDKKGTETIFFEGPFVWDCAAHGIPQQQAARELGYRCMVTFPEVPIGAAV